MGYQPPFTITTKIINLIADISECLGEIKLDNKKFNTPKLRKISRIKTITGTLQIEGNTLSEKQVTAILEGKRVLGSVKEVAEVQGAVKIYEKIALYDFKKINHLLDVHHLLMGDILTNAGQFRSGDVGVYGKMGITHIAPPASRVVALMQDLFQWLNQAEDHPLIQSCVFHYEFEFIHPFSDGNGRMGRFWQSVILNSWKPVFALIPVESMVRDHQQEYYHALEQSERTGESTIFIEFMLDIILHVIQDVMAQSDQVSAQVSDQVKKLLKTIGNDWLSSAEIMHQLKLSHKPTFRKNYLKPALEKGLLVMSEPNSPRSPKQKYKKV